MLELGSHVSAGGGADKAIARAVAIDARAFQIFTKNANRWKAKPLDPDVVERFRAGIEAHPEIKHIVAHDSYLINIASPDDAMWDKSRLALQDELHRCDLLGISALVSHPGAHLESGIPQGVKRVVEAINRIQDDMPNGECRLALETTAGQGTTLGSTFEELAAIIDGVEDRDRVVICLDTCHIFAAGYDITSEETYQATMKAFDDIIGLEYLHVLHLNDSLKPFDSHRDRHAHIGEGEIGTAAFGFLMNDHRLDGLPGILETPKDDDPGDDLRNLEVLRSLVN